MQTTLNAAIGRRTVLAGTAAAAIMATSTKAAPRPGTLAEVIGHHEDALQRLDDACDQLEACEAVSRGRVLVPLAVHEDGSYSSGMMELDKFSEATIRNEIEKTHDGLFRVHCSKWSKAALPAYADEMERTIEASLKRTHEAYDAILADIEKREQESGILDARKKNSAASIAETEARIDLILYPPRTIAEADQKRSYIEASTPFVENWAEDDAFFMSTLIAKAAEVQA